jgi:two-component system, OmpR family, phosphate regulon response regulator PhoB
MHSTPTAAVTFLSARELDFMPTVLIVEDETHLAELLEYNLKEHGWTPVVARTAAEARRALQKEVPQVVLLDRMLPDAPGEQLCAEIRRAERTKDIAVIMLTARGEEEDRVSGFEAGADDYVVKPFSSRELMLRLAAILRRLGKGPSPTAPLLEVGPFAVDVVEHRAYVNGALVSLTNLEFQLLRYFLEHAEKLCTRAQLLRDIWSTSSAATSRTLDMHIMRLREKLGPDAALLQTVRGVGYRLMRDDAHHRG